jgi:dTDP-4-dehydrorhamnose reductase
MISLPRTLVIGGTSALDLALQDHLRHPDIQVCLDPDEEELGGCLASYQPQNVVCAMVPLCLGDTLTREQYARHVELPELVLAQARRRDIHFMLLSSQDVFQPLHEPTLRWETDKRLGPVTGYGTACLAAEMNLLSRAHRSHRYWSSVVLRTGRLLCSDPVWLQRNTSANGRRFGVAPISWLHVQDLAVAIQHLLPLLAAGQLPELYHIANLGCLSPFQMAREISQALGQELPVTCKRHGGLGGIQLSTERYLQSGRKLRTCRDVLDELLQTCQTWKAGHDCATTAATTA